MNLSSGLCPLTVGEIFAERFELLEFLGSGGMASVYRAADRELNGASVAIKILPLSISADPDESKRFRNEVLTSRKLIHRNIVSIYDFGRSQSGHLFCTMELVEGGNLSQFLYKNGAEELHFSDILSILTQLFEALVAAESFGIIHCDLKPDNILLAPQGVIKISDFGLSSCVYSTNRMSAKLEACGTPYYMAPEQFRGEDLDTRSDIYSLGLIGYELVAREKAFRGKDYFELASKHFHDPLKDLTAIRRDVPLWYQRFIEVCSAKNTNDRYSSAQDALDSLQAHSRSCISMKRKMPSTADALPAGSKRPTNRWSTTPEKRKKTTLRGRTALGLPADAVEESHPVGQQMQVLSQAHLSLGREYMRLNRLGDARRHLGYAVQLNPQDPIAATLYGCTVQLQGQLDLAEHWYHIALQLDAHYKDAYYHLGHLYQMLGKPEAAIANFGTFLSICRDQQKPTLRAEQVRMLKEQLEKSLQ